MREAAKGTAGERSTAGDVARKGIKRRNAGKKGRRGEGKQGVRRGACVCGD